MKELEKMMKRKPNIVFILTDDQRYDTIGALGNKEIKTPNINELVREGFSFTNAHIPGGTCGAVCMPSRAMIHSGRFLFSLKEEGQSIPKEHITLGEILQNVGYSTYGIGKWHNGTESFNRSFADGDEIFFGGMWDHWNVPANHYDPTGNYKKAAEFTTDFYHSNMTEKMRCDHINIGSHSTTIFGDAACNFIDNYNKDNPFFLYTAFMAPHDPRTMPKKFLTMYNLENIELPQNYEPNHKFNFGVRHVRDELLEEYPRQKNAIRQHILEYYAMITHLDYEIGRIVKALKKNGVYKNTIIVLAGDNGLALGQHGLMGKQNNYEHSVRVPLIFAGPCIPKNKKSTAHTYLMDIYPTLLDLVDIEVPNTVEAQSLVKCFDGRSEIRESLYLAYTDLMRSVKKGKYKLIEYASDYIRKTQLFDLSHDPMEMKDLSGDEKYSKIIDELRRELFILRDTTNDKSHALGDKYWKCYNKNI